MQTQTDLIRGNALKPKRRPGSARTLPGLSTPELLENSEMNKILESETDSQRQAGSPPDPAAIACIALAGKVLREGLRAGDFDGRPEFFIGNAESAADIAAMLSAFQPNCPELRIDTGSSPSRRPPQNAVRREWSYALFGHAADILRDQAKFEAELVAMAIVGTAAAARIAGILAVVEKLIRDIGEGMNPYPAKVYGGAVALAIEGM